jgi:hypothetical protein
LAVIEKDLTVLKSRLCGHNDLLERLEDARNSLVRAQTLVQFNPSSRKMKWFEKAAIVEMMDSYNCGSDIDDCASLIMDEARENQKQAFLAAATAGFYTP